MQANDVCGLSLTSKYPQQQSDLLELKERLLWLGCALAENTSKKHRIAWKEAKKVGKEGSLLASSKFDED